ncbi:MAG: DUF4168 domain-containing protein [Steroidobacteraceae bacterium]
MRQFIQRLVTLVVAVIASGGLRAQELDIPSPSSFIDEQTIDQLADAYIAIEEIQTRANAELQNAEDQQGAYQVIESAQNAIIRAVERAGLNLRDFNRLSELAALDPTLSARIVERVRERQPI